MTKLPLTVNDLKADKSNHDYLRRTHLDFGSKHKQCEDCKAKGWGRRLSDDAIYVLRTPTRPIQPTETHRCEACHKREYERVRIAEVVELCNVLMQQVAAMAEEFIPAEVSDQAEDE